MIETLARPAPPGPPCTHPDLLKRLNLVERFFAYATSDLLQHGDQRRVQALEADIRARVKAGNANPNAFVWAKTPDDPLAKLGRPVRRASMRVTSVQPA